MNFAEVQRAAPCVLFFLVLSFGGQVAAQTLGDATKGRDYAKSTCAECHNVAPGGKTSKVVRATPFQVVADTPGMTGTALTVFFRTPHKAMPNLIIAGEDADNVIAYILSLRQN